jgi:hypothetical protein
MQRDKKYVKTLERLTDGLAGEGGRRQRRESTLIDCLES